MLPCPTAPSKITFTSQLSPICPCFAWEIAVEHLVLAGAPPLKFLMLRWRCHVPGWSPRLFLGEEGHYSLKATKGHLPELVHLFCDLETSYQRPRLLNGFSIITGIGYTSIITGMGPSPMKKQ